MADDQIEEIKQKVDIVTVVGERVALKKAGRNYKGLCPFHGEKSPSFFVTPEMGIYKCFGCGEGGDIFSFLMKYEGLDFREALEQLAHQAGVTLKKYSRDEANPKDRLYEILNLSAEYYHYLLTKHEIGQPALGYLKSRGVFNQTIKDYKLGYAPNSWSGLIKYLSGKKGYKPEELERAGMVVRGYDVRSAKFDEHDASNLEPRTSNRYYDRFRGRVMFPLQNFSGKIVGFSGRVLDADVKEAKYINSPETEIYHKGEMLYGIYQGKQVIRGKDKAIVVEGEMDVIACHQIGLKEVVGIKGSALTAEQVSLLRRLTKKVVLSLDADAAGQEAMKRAIGVAENQGVSLWVSSLSGGKDASEMALKEPDKLKDNFSKQLSIFAFLIDLAIKKEDVTTGEGKSAVVNQVLPEIGKIAHTVEREHYLEMLSQKLAISKQAIMDEYSRWLRQSQLAIQVPDSFKEKRKLSRRENLERQVLGLGLQVDKLQVLSVEWFEEPHYRRLVKLWLEEMPREWPMSRKVNEVPGELAALAQELYMAESRWMEGGREELDREYTKSLRELKKISAEKELADLARQMEMEHDEARLAQIQAKYREVSIVIKEL